MIELSDDGEEEVFADAQEELAQDALDTGVEAEEAGVLVSMQQAHACGNFQCLCVCRFRGVPLEGQQGYSSVKSASRSSSRTAALVGQRKHGTVHRSDVFCIYRRSSIDMCVDKKRTILADLSSGHADAETRGSQVGRGRW